MGSIARPRPSRPGGQAGGAGHLVQGRLDGAHQRGVGPQLAAGDARPVLAQAPHEAAGQGLLEGLGAVGAQERSEPAEGDDVGVGDVDQPDQADDGIVVNGMSTSARNSKWSNAAIVVETRPEDIGQEFIKKADACLALAGLYWRAHLEREAKLHAKGQAAPAQRMEDFLTHRKSTSLPSTSFTPGVISSRLDEWLPPHIETRLEKAFSDFNKNMRGFISSDALLIAVETRTSTPVRILRSKETGECTSIERLYPAGEGSGYSGGIVSSAMDGENAAALIAKRFAARQ